MKKRYFAWVFVLALLVVIGGVYATWNYATQMSENQDLLIAVELAEKNVTRHGTIALSGEMKVSLDDTNNDHEADIVMQGDDITVTYTPNENGPDEIQMQFELTLPGLKQGSGSTEDVIRLQASVTMPQALNSGAACSTVTITKAEIQNLIEAHLSLPTESDYDTFKSYFDSFEDKNIKLTVSEVEPEP